MILHYAHRELERLTLDKDTFRFKEIIAQKYSELVYDGLWHSPLRQALDAFINQTQRFVSGEVKLKLYKGNCTVVGRKSPYSLYEKKLATYSEEDTFDQKASQGFIHIWSLPLKTISKTQRREEKK
ncbi:unnamed protein product [marine sediment metagenome]|uniref:argininosuccinate synthase n=1 Tax=marine sediment metagenome TaxID=412755 RepID=X0SY61_9ZZZZ